ncbi:Rv1535 domain-containing protein [Mycobacterium spongiae]|uniref:Rv1535 domain-containing protein n=1 Tax=Mycobacterium spongiae TaxID=886343 RepID=UPI001FE71E0F|nr:Rv1535 domain-containing protein [Mycobacterium spongiae]
MPRTDAQADPLVSSIAVLLSVPLRELYALLWRVGVVEVRGTDPARRPQAMTLSSSAGRGLMCPDPSAHEPDWRRSQQSGLLGPAPGHPVRGGCSRAAG